MEAHYKHMHPNFGLSVMTDPPLPTPPVCCHLKKHGRTLQHVQNVKLLGPELDEQLTFDVRHTQQN